ncbi:hypothetical protein ALNOE001_11920 [Candidatus Methanobinarius endosymbioticus]|uniref:Uncharacterized protein n=1 Tax=Candidatus Methanobinarius endosymbioticus TaxID=2006182 RepID=A0A366MAL7_9EURY|nr:hypothetical protein ALNOE001_11920 [Candidatus Methanobinarius endosymbioticus]
MDSVANNSAELNWWGLNFPNFNFTGFNPIKTWYVLKLSAEEIETLKNATKNYQNRYNATLKYELSTNIPTEHDPNQLPEFMVTIIGPNREIRTADICNTSLSYFVKGKVVYSIQSLSDDEDIILNVSLPQEPEPPVLPVPPVPPIPNPDKNETNKTKKNPIENNVNASMKPTSIHILAIILVLLASLGLTYKKQ